MKLLALAAVLFFLFLLQPAAAAHVKVLAPVEKTVDVGNADALDLGLVGPGQKLELIVSVGAGEISKAGQTDSKKEAEWDWLQVVHSSLPQGWSGQDSLRFESPMKAFVVVAKDAPDGDYYFEFKVNDDFEGVTQMTIKAKARVRRELLSLRIVDEPVKLESNTKGTFQIELHNLASANDAFQLSLSGLPHQTEENTGQQIFVPLNSKVKVSVPVTAAEVGEYAIEFKAVSLSSPAIWDAKGTTLFAGTTLTSDLKAAGRGMLLFPSAAAAIYSLLSVLSGIFLG